MTIELLSKLGIDNILFATFWHNKIYEYLLVLLSLLVGMLLIKFCRRLLVKNVKTILPIEISSGLEKVGKKILSFIYIALLYGSIQFISFPKSVAHAVNVAVIGVLGVYIIHIFNNSVLEYFVKKYLSKRGYGSNLLTIQFSLIFSKIIVWIVGIILLADNIGLKITPVLAGLGISGVAVALASQVLLKDLFSCFAIYFDRPFNVGDLITIDDLSGTVEHIGVKTTRIRSLSGEELIMSNSDLTESRVRNYKRMERRRVLFPVKVLYDTPLEKLQLIPKVIEDIMHKMEWVTFDRAHLIRFDDKGLEFEVVYYVSSNDYRKYMDVQQDINFGIIKYFNENEIVFANLGLAKNIHLPKDI